MKVDERLKTIEKELKSLKNLIKTILSSYEADEEAYQNPENALKGLMIKGEISPREYKQKLKLLNFQNKSETRADYFY